MQTRLKFSQNIATGKKLLDDDICDFAVLDRSTPGRPLFHLLTRRNDVHLPNWTMLHEEKNNIKKYSTKAFKDEFVAQLKELYGKENVAWVGNVI